MVLPNDLSSIPVCPAVQHTPWHLSIGMFIGILGFLGVVVPLVREKIGRREKAVWTFVFAALLYWEFRSINLEDIQHDREQAFSRCEELRSFKEIASTLSQSIDQAQAQYQNTLGHVDGVMKTTQRVSGITEKSLENITGGDSNAYFEFLYLNDRIPEIWVQNSGKYPLRNLSVQIEDVNKMDILYESRTPRTITMQDTDISTQNIHIGDLGVHQTMMIPVNPASHGDDLVRYLISYSALNGGGMENVVVRVGKDGKRYKAVKTGGTNQPTEKESIDPNFPLNAAGKIW